MRAARNSCSKGNIDHSNSALAATDKIYVYILRSKCGKTQVIVSIKSVRFVTNSKGINIDRSKSALAATDKICIFFVNNFKVQSSASALAETDKICVHILRSKCGKTAEMLSIKRVRFIILAS